MDRKIGLLRFGSPAFLNQNLLVSDVFLSQKKSARRTGSLSPLKRTDKHEFIL